MGKLERLGFAVKKTKGEPDEVVWVVKWKGHPVTSLRLMLDDIDSNYMSRHIYPRPPAFRLTCEGVTAAFESLPSRKDRALKLVDFHLSQFCNAVIVSHCRLKPTASCRHGADERLAPLRARPEPNLLGGSLSLPDKIITQPKERRIPLSPKGDSPLRPFSMDGN